MTARNHKTIFSVNEKLNALAATFVLPRNRMKGQRKA